MTNHAEYREKVFGALTQLVFLDGFDKDEKEQEDVDGKGTFFTYSYFKA